jgi:disulfide bond formation protein DsbB
MPRPDFRTTAIAVLAASIAILLAAFAFQYLGGLHPCVLCLYQRYPYGVTIAAAAGALAFAATGRSSPARGLMGLCGVAFLVGAATAAFHVGVEQHWWAGTSECGGLAGEATSIDALKRQLLGQPVVRCDAVAWSFLGISMAGWNVLLSMALSGLSLFAAVTPPQELQHVQQQHAR